MLQILGFKSQLQITSGSFLNAQSQQMQQGRLLIRTKDKQIMLTKAQPSQLEQILSLLQGRKGLAPSIL